MVQMELWSGGSKSEREILSIWFFPRQPPLLFTITANVDCPRHTFPESLVQMPRPKSSPLFSLCFLLLISATANALHFYLDANEKRCFLEEVPSNTVVEGVPA